MVLQGSKLYWQAWASGGAGFLTFGWDAGVLGGILLTDSFQRAMGVCSCCLEFGLLSHAQHNSTLQSQFYP